METSNHSLSAILRQRAEEYAGQAVESHRGDPLLEVVAARLGDHSVGFPLGATVSVVSCPPIAPLPGDQPVLRGLAHVRGEIVSVADLGALLGSPGPASDALLVLLAGPQGTLGLPVDQLIGTRQIYGDEISDVLTGRHAERGGPVQYVTRDSLLVLDPTRLHSLTTWE